MKRWHKRTLLVLVLGAAGFIALAMRPALVPDEVEQQDAGLNIPLPSDQAEAAGKLAVSYRWDLADSPGITLSSSPDGVNLFRDCLRRAEWCIGFVVSDGKLLINAETPLLHAVDRSCLVQTQSRLALRSRYRVRMPDGTFHNKYVIELAIAARLTPSFWGKTLNSSLHQLLLVDPVAGTFDPMDPSAYLFVPSEGAELTRAPGAPELPARYSGSFRRQQMLRLLDLLASITDARTADAAAPVLQSRAEQLVQLCADAQAPWPQNWGDDREAAEEVHRAVIPTLLYLQEKDCHNSADLADFINGEAFGRIFGESFRDGGDSTTDPADGGNSPLPRTNDAIPFNVITDSDLADDIPGDSSEAGSGASSENGSATGSADSPANSSAGAPGDGASPGAPAMSPEGTDDGTPR